MVVSFSRLRSCCQMIQNIYYIRIIHCTFTSTLFELDRSSPHVCGDTLMSEAISLHSETKSEIFFDVRMYYTVCTSIYTFLDTHQSYYRRQMEWKKLYLRDCVNAHVQYMLTCILCACRCAHRCPEQLLLLGNSSRDLEISTEVHVPSNISSTLRAYAMLHGFLYNDLT